MQDSKLVFYNLFVLLILKNLQDTIKSNPPELVAMKKATVVGVSVTTMFYMLCGLLGYIAFGSDAPGNFLAGFGYFEPTWIVDFANACIVVHLVGAYQVNLHSNKAGDKS